MVSQSFTSWNRISDWLNRVRALQKGAERSSYADVELEHPDQTR